MLCYESLKKVLMLKMLKSEESFSSGRKKFLIRNKTRAVLYKTIVSSSVLRMRKIFSTKTLSRQFLKRKKSVGTTEL